MRIKAQHSTLRIEPDKIELIPNGRQCLYVNHISEDVQLWCLQLNVRFCYLLNIVNQFYCVYGYS